MRNAFFRRHKAAVQRCARLTAWFAPFALAFSLLVGLPDVTYSQQLPAGLSPTQLQQLQQQFGGQLPGQGSTTVAVPPQSQPLMLQPAPEPTTTLPRSRLEQIMSARAGTLLGQHGYAQLGRGAAVIVPQTGAVQDNYVLGPGDEIVVSMRGQENSEQRAPVDRNGQVVLPRLGPISASGRSFGSFRQDVETAVGRAYVATTASVSVAQMRQISVMVTGTVNNPGQRLLTGLSSVLDALLLSGGVSKGGSLRDVRLIRGGRQYPIDLYGVLSGSASLADMRLADGDRIFVAPLGRTVAIAGLVRIPGIYELAPGQTSISAQALVALAGGPEVNGAYLYSLLHLQPDGRTVLQSLKSQSEQIADGEILVLQLQADQTSSRATLAGGTGLAGNYPIAGGSKLSDIIRLPGALGTSPYTLIGIIARRDPRTLMRSLAAFTPTAVLNGGEDVALQSDDVVRVLSVDEMHMMVETVRAYGQWREIQDERLRNPISTNGSLAANGAAALTGQTPTTGPFANNGQTNGQSATGGQQPSGQVNVNGQNGMTGNGQGGMAGNGQGGMAGQFAANGAPPMLGGQPGAPDAATMQQDALQSLIGRTGSQTNVSGQAGAQIVVGSAALPPNFVDQTVAPGGYAQNREATTFAQVAQQLGVDPLVLTNFLIDHQVTIDGAVQGPGTYFVGPSVTLQDLIMGAGGTANWVDASGVELISTIVDPATGRSASKVTKLPLSGTMTASYVVKPHDAFRFNQIFTDVDVGSVMVQGEVRFTGSYRLTRGERLSDLLVRAGGLTNTAYPYGTIFLRKSIAAMEQEGYLRAAREVEDQLVVSMTRIGNDKIDPATFASMQSFVVDLRNQKPIGRIAISADPSVLAANPALDPVLESGDVIYIPPRPSTISVLGQVMQPGSFPYRAGNAVSDYIARAGGYSRLADEGQTYIVLPDGTARRLEKSWLRVDTLTLPPGSAIVVPRDVTPLDLRQTVIDVSQILSQLAVSIASVAVLSRQ